VELRNLPANGTWSIFQANGQMMAKGKLNGQSRIALDLPHFTNGNYFVSIQTEDGRASTKRMVISR
jgi:hypothetical protein